MNHQIRLVHETVTRKKNKILLNGFKFLQVISTYMHNYNISYTLYQTTFKNQCCFSNFEMLKSQNSFVTTTKPQLSPGRWKRTQSQINKPLSHPSVQRITPKIQPFDIIRGDGRQAVISSGWRTTETSFLIHSNIQRTKFNYIILNKLVCAWLDVGRGLIRFHMISSNCAFN